MAMTEEERLAYCTDQFRQLVYANPELHRWGEESLPCVASFAVYGPRGSFDWWGNGLRTHKFGGPKVVALYRELETEMQAYRRARP